MTHNDRTLTDEDAQRVFCACEMIDRLLIPLRKRPLDEAVNTADLYGAVGGVITIRNIVQNARVLA